MSREGHNSENMSRVKITSPAYTVKSIVTKIRVDVLLTKLQQDSKSHGRNVKNNLSNGSALQQKDRNSQGVQSSSFTLQVATLQKSRWEKFKGWFMGHGHQNIFSSPFMIMCIWGFARMLINKGHIHTKPVLSLSEPFSSSFAALLLCQEISAR